ncbi:MAG: ATP-binding protein [Candidatus Omnitrophota bacterium]
MKLTGKIPLFILTIYILLLSIFFVSYQILFYKPINEQKREFAHNIIDGVLFIFLDEANRIVTLCENWANQKPISDYLANHADGLVPKPFPDLQLREFGLSLFIVVDENRNIVNMQGYDFLGQRPFPFQLLSQKRGISWGFFMKVFNVRKTVYGIVHSEYGPMIVASTPIRRNNGKGNRIGRLLLGRLIDKQFEERIQYAAGKEIHLLLTPFREIMPPGLFDDPSLIRLEKNDKKIIITYPIRDEGNRHILTIKAVVPAPMFDLLDDAAGSFLILLIAGFILSGATLYFLVNYLVVRRIKEISIITNNIVSFDDLSQRIPETYKDEISSLGGNINQMLNRLKKESIKKDEVERMAMLNDKLIFLGRVTANITHEINNPLFAIDNSIQVIKKYLPKDDEDLNEVVELAENEIKRAKEITRGMHKLVMPSVESYVVSDISVIIEAAINVVKWSKQAKEVTVDYLKSSHYFPLLCNPGALQQVFVNLISNSIEAMEGKGRVVIDVFEKDEEYRIDFIDTGPGFSDDIKPNLFKPFKSTKTEGSGLGLNISYHIITNHGGTIILNDTYRDGAHLIIKIPADGGSRFDEKILLPTKKKDEPEK